MKETVIQLLVCRRIGLGAMYLLVSLLLQFRFIIGLKHILKDSSLISPHDNHCVPIIFFLLGFI